MRVLSCSGIVSANETVCANEGEGRWVIMSPFLWATLFRHDAVGLDDLSGLKSVWINYLHAEQEHVSCIMFCDNM